MKKPPAAHGVTLVEAARVLSKLERRPISPSQVRSILVLGTTARAMQPRRSGDTRLYSAVDLAVVRLTLRLRAAGVGATVARVVVACLRDQLVQQWQDGDPMALAVVGMRGLLVPDAMPRPAGVVAWVKLSSAWAGIEDHVRLIRERAPDVWRWKPTTAAVGA